MVKENPARTESGVLPVEPVPPFHPFVWKLLLVSGALIYGTYTILIHLCEAEGKLPFSSSSVVLSTEVVKLIISVALLAISADVDWCCVTFSSSLPYAVPAILYWINNNIGIHMQLYMDPTTYQVLSNLKILSTAILYRIIIKRTITDVQWAALLILVIAGASNSYGGLMAAPDTVSPAAMHISWQGLAMISLYCFISGLSGVYTEYIVKRKYELSIHIQNSLLYTFGIILNLCTWISGELNVTTGRFHLFRGYSTYVWLLIGSQAIIGLIMSAVMKHGSNITRLFLISSAMLVTTLLSVIIFHFHINVYYAASLLLVLVALTLYHKK